MTNQELTSSGNSIGIKEYVDLRFNNLADLFETKVMAQEKALTLASGSLSIRLDLMNEFRAQLTDQAATFFTRPEHDLYMNKTSDDLKRLGDEHGLFVIKNEHVVTHTKIDEDIRTLRESKAQLEGKASQFSVNLATVIAIVGIVISMLALFHNFTEKPTMVPQITSPGKLP